MWINPKPVTLSERGQTQARTVHYTVPLTWNSGRAKLSVEPTADQWSRGDGGWEGL